MVAGDDTDVLEPNFEHTKELCGLSTSDEFLYQPSDGTEPQNLIFSCIESANQLKIALLYAISLLALYALM